MPDPNLPVIQDIPATEYLSVSRTKIMSNYGALSAAATETSAGLVELATSAEVLAGTDTQRVVTPLTLTKYVQTLSGDWGKSNFNELDDVNITSYSSAQTGYYVSLVSGTSGLKLELVAPEVLAVEESNICYDHDYASSDTDFRLPLIASYPNSTVGIIRALSSTTVTISPSGSNTIMGANSAYINEDTTENYSSIFMRAVGNNWVVVNQVGNWGTMPVSGTLPSTKVDVTPRYTDTNSPSGSISIRERIYVSEVYNNGTAAGYSTSANAWIARRINTLVDPLSVATINTGAYTFTLPAGKYKINGYISIYCYAVGQIQRVRLRKTSGTAITLVTALVQSGTENTANNTLQPFIGSFTLTDSSNTLQIQHFSTSSLNIESVPGSSDTSGENNILTLLEIEKIT